MSLISIIKSSKFVDKIILIKQKIRLIRAIGYAELKVRGQKKSV